MIFHESNVHKVLSEDVVGSDLPLLGGKRSGAIRPFLSVRESFAVRSVCLTLLVVTFSFCLIPQRVSADVTSSMLSISKTSDLFESAAPHDVITYTIVITNSGAIPQTGIHVLDMLPSGVTYVPGSVTGSIDPLPSSDATTGLLRVQYENHSRSALSQSIMPRFRIFNDGEEVVALTDIKLRYWFTSEPPGADIFVADWAQVGTGAITHEFGSMDGESYVDIGFTSAASVPTWVGGDGQANRLLPGIDTGPIHLRIHDSAWGTYDQSNDYSWDPTFTSYADFDRVTLLYQGEAVWGPGVSTDSFAPPPTLVTEGRLESGSTMTMQFQVTVDQPLVATQLVNAASVISDQEPTPRWAAVTNQVAMTDLAVSMAVSEANPTELDTISYIITVTNEGPREAGDVVIESVLPLGLTFSHAESTHGEYSNDLGEWNVGELAVDEVASMTLSVTVDSNTAGSWITHSARLGSANVADSNASNNEASVDIYVSFLRIQKSSDVIDFAAPGDLITYTIMIDNRGLEAHTGIQVEDLLPADLTFVPDSVSIMIDPPPGPDLPVDLHLQYLNAATTASFQSLRPRFRIFNEGSAAVAMTDITMRYWFTSEPPGSDIFICDWARVGTGAITHEFGSIEGESYVEIGFTDAASLPTWMGGDGSANRLPAGTETGEIHLRIRDSAWGYYDQSNDFSWDPTFVEYAEYDRVTLYYQGQRVWGYGPIDHANYAQPISLPGSGSHGAGHIGNPPEIASDWTLAAGSTMTIVLQALVNNATSESEIINSAFVTSDQEPNPLGVSVTNQLSFTDLEVSLIVNDSTPAEGDTIVYTASITNLGPLDTTGVEVDAAVPAGLTFSSAATSQGSFDSETGNWMLGALTVGEVATLHLSVTVDSSASGTDIPYTVRLVDTDVADANPANNEATVVISPYGTVPETPDPLIAATVAADGPQLVRLNWTANAANHSVLILHKEGAITEVPNNGVGYAVGDSIGEAQVIYHGSGSELEFIATANQQHHFRLFSVDRSYYSEGMARTVTMPTYGKGIIDLFSYTNQTSLGGGNTGQGWSGPWSVESGIWEITRNLYPTFPLFGGQPCQVANRVRLTATDDELIGSVFRPFPEISTGSVFVSFQMAFSQGGAHKWAGLSFVDGGTERAYWGKGFGAEGFAYAIGQDHESPTWSGESMYGQNSGTNMIYLVIGKYNIASGEIFGMILDPSQAVPSDQPPVSKWHVQMTGSSAGAVSGIRLSAGVVSGAESIGDVWFDELRMVPSWQELMDHFKVTDGIAQSQSVGTSNSETKLFWQSESGQEYDLLRMYTDQTDFSGKTSFADAWEVVETTTQGNAVDPANIEPGMMRFYRATPRGRANGFSQANEPPRASEEIYVSIPITLHPGQNWVAFPGIAPSATVARVFNGARHLPAGWAAIDSTRITWFNRGSGDPNAYRQIWLDQNSGEWRYNADGAMSAEDALIDVQDGIVIEIPQTAATAGQTYTMLFVGRVPDSRHADHHQVQIIHGDNAHNLINIRLPQRMHPREMNLVTTNAAGGVTVGMAAGLGVSHVLGNRRSDAIWSLNRVDQGPAGILYYNDGAESIFPVPGWYRVGNGGPTAANQLAADFHFAADDAILLRSFRTTQDWAWTNPIPYSPPCRFMLVSE